MDIETLIELFYQGSTTKYEGTIKIKDIDTRLSSELLVAQNQQLVWVNKLSFDKTNVAMLCTYIVDPKTDDKNTVIGDFESLVSFMYFGVDKVAKSPPIKE